MNAELPLPSSMPPLLVVGAGKLGSAVAKAWVDHGGTIHASVSAGETWTPDGLVFEATAPSAAYDNVQRCVQANVPVVTGTTGWLHQLGGIEATLQSSGGTVFWSTNFSPGVHALNQIAQHAAGIFDKIPGYEAHIQEVHHVHKKDAPSGTALTLQEHAIGGGWSREMPIKSHREGEVIGLHALAWDSVHDAVVLQHEAKSRLGFAEGAVWALRWTWQRHLEREFGLYTMTDLFRT